VYDNSFHYFFAQFRSSYTRRILEIIGNIKKQKREITKVLQDTKDIQKDINTLTGRLDRTFAVADELIYKVCNETVPSNCNDSLTH